MPVNHVDVGMVAEICQEHQNRVRYGVLGAAISSRVGNPAAAPRAYTQATVAMLNAFFEERCAAASWVVGENGYPTGYEALDLDPNWNIATALHNNVAGFLEWLDHTQPGWDENLESTYP
jgi:hypothetical protein